MLFLDLKNSFDGKYLHPNVLSFSLKKFSESISVAICVESDTSPATYLTASANSGSCALHKECPLKFKALLLSSFISFLSLLANSSAHFVSFESTSSMHITFSIYSFRVISISTRLE